MRTVALFLTVLALFITGCQQEDQRPITQAPGGGSPLQAENQIKFLKSILNEDRMVLQQLIRIPPGDHPGIVNKHPSSLQSKTT